MASKWSHLKRRAIQMRKSGKSIRDVENKLGIPRSTLSGWFKNIELSKKHKAALLKKWQGAIIKARNVAVRWHNEQKSKRLEAARLAANQTVDNLDINNPYIMELALAMLYWGEGNKGMDTGMGNADPKVLNFFISTLKSNYGIPIEKIKCELHLRADQNGYAMKRWWSRQLNIPIKNFFYTYFDKRTKDSKTFRDYKGVCLVRCGNVAIQRKLINISKEFCKRVCERA